MSLVVLFIQLDCRIFDHQYQWKESSDLSFFAWRNLSRERSICDYYFLVVCGFVHGDNNQLKVAFKTTTLVWVLQVCLLARQIPRFDLQYLWKEIIDTFFWSLSIFFLIYFLAFFTKYSKLRFNCDLLNRNSLFVIIMFFFKHNKMSAKKKVFNLVIYIFIGDIQMTISWRIWLTIQLGMWWS